MSWIWQNWSTKYVEDAEQKIKAIVSHVNSLSIAQYINYASQLVEYQEWARAERNIVGSSPTAPNPVQSNQVPAYFTLAEDYGLPQDMYFATSNNSDQTVEEEFSSYVSGSLSLQGTNMLKFWEVRIQQHSITPNFT